MRFILVLLCTALAAVAFAQEPTDPPAEPAGGAATEPVDTGRADLPARSLLQEQSLERNLPARQQRRIGEGDQSFLGLYLPAAQAEALGAVLLIGDDGEHANWPRLIAPARRLLSEAGWHTLSIALPDSLPPLFGMDEEAAAARTAIHASEVTSRIDAALTSLQQEGAPRTVILARGLGAYWALQAAMGQDQVESLVLYQPSSPLLAERPLDQMMAEAGKPVLDILVKGREASTLPRERQTQAKRLGNEHYHQLLINDSGATPEAQQMLVKRIEGWLKGPESQRNPR